MSWYCKLSLIFLLFLCRCSSVPNINSTNETEREVEWDKVIGSLLPSDPVPSEIDYKKGYYLNANVQYLNDGDTLTVNNVDTSSIKDKEIKNKIEYVLISNNGTIAIRFISIDTPEITNGKNEYYG